MKHKLDERLMSVASLVKRCDVLADIGCDHGFLVMWLLEHTVCNRAWACDISGPSLRKAQILAAKMNLLDRVNFGIGDGIQAVKEKVDTIVIAGMGTESIKAILKDGITGDYKPTLILQSNIDLPELRRSLVTMCYTIEEEVVSKAAGRWYVAMRAIPGLTNYGFEEFEIGPSIVTQSDDTIVLAYGTHQLAKLETRLSFLNQQLPQYEQTFKLIKAWRRFLGDSNI